MKDLLDRLRECFGTQPFTARDVIDARIPVEDYSVLVHYVKIRQESGRNSSVARSIGSLLRKLDGVEAVGRTRDKATLWRVKS